MIIAGNAWFIEQIRDKRVMQSTQIDYWFPGREVKRFGTSSPTSRSEILPPFSG
jgi:hypothetical protein